MLTKLQDQISLAFYHQNQAIADFYEIHKSLFDAEQQQIIEAKLFVKQTKSWRGMVLGEDLYNELVESLDSAWPKML